MHSGGPFLAKNIFNPMDAQAAKLIEQLARTLLELDEDIAPHVSQWLVNLEEQAAALDPVELHAFLGAKRDEFASDTDAAVAALSKALADRESAMSIWMEGPQMHQDERVVGAVHHVLKTHLLTSGAKDDKEVGASLLAMLTDQRILEAKRAAVLRMVEKNKVAYDEYRLQRSFEAAGQQGKGRQKSTYTAARQALLMFYLLKALGVDGEHAADYASLARVLHVLAGTAPPQKNGKEAMASSTIYQGVKKMFAYSDRQQLADLQFLADKLSPLAASEAAGFKAMLDAIERQIRSVKTTFEKEK